MMPVLGDWHCPRDRGMVQSVGRKCRLRPLAAGCALGLFVASAVGCSDTRPSSAAGISGELGPDGGSDAALDGDATAAETSAPDSPHAVAADGNIEAAAISDAEGATDSTMGATADVEAPAISDAQGATDSTMGGTADDGAPSGLGDAPTGPGESDTSTRETSGAAPCVNGISSPECDVAPCGAYVNGMYQTTACGAGLTCLIFGCGLGGWTAGGCVPDSINGSNTLVLPSPRDCCSTSAVCIQSVAGRPVPYCLPNIVCSDVSNLGCQCAPPP